MGAAEWKSRVRVFSSYAQIETNSRTPREQTPYFNSFQRRYVQKELENSMEVCVSAGRAVEFQALVLRAYEQFCKHYRKSAKNVDYKTFRKHIRDIVRRNIELSELKDALSQLC